jgi:hypothetical protein
MSSRLRIGLIALAVLPVCAVGCTAEPAVDETVAPAVTPRTMTETCSTRSEASFPGAFNDPGNLVVGPFVLVGAARPTRSVSWNLTRAETPGARQSRSRRVIP